MTRPLLAQSYIKDPNKGMSATTAFILSFELQVIYRAIQMFDNRSTVCNVIAQTLGVEYQRISDFLNTPLRDTDALVKRVNEVCREEFPTDERPTRLVDLI